MLDCVGSETERQCLVATDEEVLAPKESGEAFVGGAKARHVSTVRVPVRSWTDRFGQCGQRRPRLLTEATEVVDGGWAASVR
jgi:hypothetical protein